METSRTVSLLTDFGLRDPFVGVMKGVIAAVDRSLLVVDLTHEIAPQAIEQGAFWLARSFGYFAPGTVHVAVVDPGVGTARRPLVVRAAGHLFVGPDNGLLGPVLALAGAEARRLDPGLGLPVLSQTFHGRDLFAPAAARLASGAVGFDEVGPEVSDPVALPGREPPGQGQGRVAVIDRYGNLLTDIDAGALVEGCEVEVAGRRVPVRRAYGEVAPGEAVALAGSFGTVEVAIRDGDAASGLGAGVGDGVRVVAPLPR